jgi:lipid-binding SYLF domain-containing protein
MLIVVLLAGLVFPALGADKADLEKKLGLLSAKFEELQAKPDKAVPADNLKRACGVVLLYRVKGGLVFGYEGGSGVAMIRNGVSNRWSAPVFMKSNEGSFGAQIGGQTSFTVVLLMNTNAVAMLTQPTFNFGGEASGTGGNASAKEEGKTTSVEQLTMVYSDVSGLYGGATIKGGSLSPDSEADIAYYGQFLTAREILFDGKGQPTEAATRLANRLNEFSK